MHKFPRLKGWLHKCNKEPKRIQFISSLPSYPLKQLHSHWGPCRKILWWRGKQLSLGAPLPPRRSQSSPCPENHTGSRGMFWMKCTNSNYIAHWKKIFKAQESKLQFSRFLVQWSDKSVLVCFWLLWLRFREETHFHDFMLQKAEYDFWFLVLVWSTLVLLASFDPNYELVWNAFRL